MHVTKPTYIVAELPAAIAEWVRLTRNTLEPAIAHMPAEITIAGSSGVGPLKVGQSIEFVEATLKSILQARLPFETYFVKLTNFPGTDIFFAAPERDIFAEIHSAVISSGLKFEASSHPYVPHCSLKGYTPLKLGQREVISTLDFPKHRFSIREIAVYEMDGMQPKKLFSISA